MDSLIARVGREWSKWWRPKTPDDVLKTEILTDDLPTLSHLLENPSPPTLTPGDVLLLSARLSRPISFDYLLAHYPDLASSPNQLLAPRRPVRRLCPCLAHNPRAQTQGQKPSSLSPRNGGRAVRVIEQEGAVAVSAERGRAGGAGEVNIVPSGVL